MSRDRNTYWMKDFKTGEQVEIPVDQLDSVSLENVGNPNVVPLHQGGFTQVSTYFLWFWCKFLSPAAQTIYIHLLAHAFGEKTVARPSRKLIASECNMAESTFWANFSQLEQHYLAWRIECIKPDGSNANNHYIVRSNVPLLSQEQYEQLPEELQDLHDGYLRNLQRSGLYSEVYYQRPLPPLNSPPKKRGRPRKTSAE